MAATKPGRKNAAKASAVKRTSGARFSTVKSQKAAVSASVARRGRRPQSLGAGLDRKAIIAHAFEQSRGTPLQELSILRIARELGVAPGLIHYYLDGRDALMSGVMNSFYGEMLADWPAPTGQWRMDVEAVLQRVYDSHVRYPGIAAYVVAHNRYRMEQMLVEGETDYGVQLFESVVAAVSEAGFGAFRTAMLSHLLMEFVTSMAFAAVWHRFPGEHGEHLKGVFAKLDPKKFPFTNFVAGEFVRLKAPEAFAEGLRLLLNATEAELPAVRGRKKR